MKTKLHFALIKRAALLLLASTINHQLSTFAQGSAFTYQGRLNDSANPAGGIYDLRFAIYDALSVGTQQGNLLTNSATAVSNGLFTVTLDFGNQFPGANRWLEFGVRTNGGGSFITLSPRQQVTSTPYAIRAANFSGAVDVSQLNGTIPLAQLPAAVVTNGSSNLNLNGTFSGNGAGITNVGLSSLNTGGAIMASGGFVLTSSPFTGFHPIAVAAADVNGDGKVDLISANYSGTTLSVLTNDGNGTFTLSSSPGVGSNPLSVVAADVNGDGKPDLISANSGNNTLSVLTNNGNGTFTLSSSPGGSSPHFVVAADFNGDGKLDLVSANYGNNTISVLTNKGNGTFAFLQGSTGVGSRPLSLAAADVNGDGKVDLISAMSAGTLLVLTNDGSGRVILSSSPGGGIAPSAVAAADVNGDGKLDLIVASSITNTLSVLTNNGDGTFTLSSSPTVGSPPYSVVAADVNGDGKLDLVSANYQASTLSVLTNNGNGTFTLSASLAVGSFPYSVVALDVNGDGRLDLVSANYQANTLSVLLNVPVFSGYFSGNFAGTFAGTFAGNFYSPNFRATSTSLLTTAGLPFAIGFASGGGTLLIYVSGSGWTTNAGLIGLTCSLETAQVVGSIQVYANNINMHLAFVPQQFVVTGVAAGSHTLTLNAYPGTITDAFDNFSVTMLELPF